MTGAAVPELKIEMAVTEDWQFTFRIPTEYMVFHGQGSFPHLADMMRQRLENFLIQIQFKKGVSEEEIAEEKEKMLSQAVITFIDEMASTCALALLKLESTALVAAIPNKSDKTAKIKFRESKTKALDMVNKVHHGYDKARHGVSKGRGKEFTEGELKAAIKTRGKAARQEDVAQELGVHKRTISKRVNDEFGHKNWKAAVRHYIEK